MVRKAHRAWEAKHVRSALALVALCCGLACAPSLLFALQPGPGPFRGRLEQSVAQRSGTQASVSSKAGVVPAAGALLCFGAVGLALSSAHRTKLPRRAIEAKADGGKWFGAKDISALTESVPLVMDNIAVAKVLPHRYPFLLVDKVVAFEPGKRIVGIKNVTANEPQFTGHFPDRPIMPGVLMVEAMAQLGGLVCLQAPVTDGKGEFFFGGIEGVKFRRPVVPGDTLVMEMELEKFKEKFGIAKMKGKAYVGGQLVVEVEEFTFAFVKPAAKG